MKPKHQSSSLKLLKAIKAALVLECNDIEKQLASKKTKASKTKLVSEKKKLADLVLECKDIEKKLILEKSVTPTKKKKNLAVYKAPDYPNRPEPGPRKEYIITLDKDIGWGEEIYGFKPKFIYETPTDPFNFDDDDDTKYGVSETFYYELIDVLSTNVEEIWNEPAIISITDINGKPISKKKVTPKKTTTSKKTPASTSKKKKATTKPNNLAVYKAPVYNNDSNPRKQYIIKLGEIEFDSDVYGFKPKFVYETSTDPSEADDEDDMIYGVSREFYDELLEVLSTSVDEVWNEPEIISIEEI